MICKLLVKFYSVKISDAFRTIMREEGFSALYRGIVPGLFLVRLLAFVIMPVNLALNILIID